MYKRRTYCQMAISSSQPQQKCKKQSAIIKIIKENKENEHKQNKEGKREGEQKDQQERVVERQCCFNSDLNDDIAASLIVMGKAFQSLTAWTENEEENNAELCAGKASKRLSYERSDRP